MMNTLIIILLVLIIIQIGIIYTVKSILISILLGKIDYSKISKRDLFSPDVMDAYLLAVEAPEKFSIDDYIVNIQGREIMIWSANTIDSRKFYTHNDSLKGDVKYMNSKLTYYDRILLDRLCTAVREGQTKTLEVFFDIKS